MPLRAPGPNPILLQPVHPSAAVRAWYAKSLDAMVTSMHQHVLGAVQDLWRGYEPVHAATFPAHVLGGLLDRLERHYVEQFNLRAEQTVRGFLMRALRHTDFAFTQSLRKAGFRVSPSGPLTFDSMAMDDFAEELHPRDDHGRFMTGLGNKELPTRIVGGKNATSHPDTDTHLSDYGALKLAVTDKGDTKIEQTVVTPEQKLGRLLARVPKFEMPDPPTQANLMKAFTKAVNARAEKATDAEGHVLKGDDGKAVIVTPTMKLAQILGNAKFEATGNIKSMLEKFNAAVVEKHEMEGGRVLTPIEKEANLVRDTPGLKLEPNDTAAQICEKYIDHCSRNLLYLHDSMSKEDRDRAKLWYDGAHAITEAWADRYGKTPEQVAGCIAVMSPQKDWFQNVSLAERTMDIMRDKQDHPWTEDMHNWSQTGNNTKPGTPVSGYYNTERNPHIEEIVHDLQHGGKDGGPKTLKECTGLQRAMFIRAFDETYNDKRYMELSPEGRRLGWAAKTNDDGEVIHDANGKETNGSVAWGGMSTISKCASIYEDGSVHNISDNLGDEHKVRNFYNNIINPNSTNGHVCIDTHAVAANELMPLGSGADDVLKNFGKGFSNRESGLSGTYALNHEAYVRAAKERGILPREMQSITWERVRSLFSPEFKRSDENQYNAEGKLTREGDHKVREIWARESKGEIDEQKAREEILKAVGGKFSSPAWRNRTGTDPIGSATYQSKLASPGISVHATSRPVSSRTGTADAAFNPSARLPVGANRQLVYFQRISHALGMDRVNDATMAMRRAGDPQGQPFIQKKGVWGHLALKFEMTPSMRRALAEKLDDNVGLISTRPNKGGTISRQYFGLIRDRVYHSITKGRDLFGLTEELHEALGVTRRRAGLIARDQNNKATSLFVRTRQVEVGITKAQWMHTAASIHPRQEHEDWDGMAYLIEEGMQSIEEGEQQWPGSAINCGCLSMPIIPGYNDEGDEYSTLNEEEAG